MAGLSLGFMCGTAFACLPPCLLYSTTQPRNQPNQQTRGRRTNSQMNSRTCLWVGLVSKPAFISFRQMSQASTPASGSTMMAFSRPRPRTCSAGPGQRHGGARRGEGEAGRGRLRPGSSGCVACLAGKQRWGAQLPGCLP